MVGLLSTKISRPFSGKLLSRQSGKAALFIESASNLKACISFNNFKILKYFKSCRIITPGPEKEMNSEFLLYFFIGSYIFRKDL